VFLEMMFAAVRSGEFQEPRQQERWQDRPNSESKPDQTIGAA
jgi:hypothetical protein